VEGCGGLKLGGERECMILIMIMIFKCYMSLSSVKYDVWNNMYLLRTVYGYLASER